MTKNQNSCDFPLAITDQSTNILHFGFFTGENVLFLKTHISQALHQEGKFTFQNGTEHDYVFSLHIMAQSLGKIER